MYRQDRPQHWLSSLSIVAMFIITIKSMLLSISLLLALERVLIRSRRCRRCRSVLVALFASSSRFMTFIRSAFPTYVETHWLT